MEKDVWGEIKGYKAPRSFEMRNQYFHCHEQLLHPEKVNIGTIISDASKQY